MVSALNQRGLFESTAIIVSAKHGQSPMNPAALNRIDDGKIIDALNAAWNSSHQGGKPSAKPLVALNVDDAACSSGSTTGPPPPPTLRVSSS
jgi:hypothetical protein